MLLSISQSQKDHQYEHNFLPSNTDFEYINNSNAKTMKDIFNQ